MITADLWVGAKAIWDTGKLRRVIATRCHPASIGFSSVAGCVGVVRDTDDFGVDAVLGDTGERVLAPVAAGVLSTVSISHIERMPLDRPLNIPLSEPCMIALDGERELRGRSGDVLTFTVTRRGPQRVKIREALEEAVARGLFRFGADPHHQKQSRMSWLAFQAFIRSIRMKLCLPYEILMPKLGLTMTEGTVEEWKFREGDYVKKGDALFSVSTDKLTNDVESEAEGVLLKILLPAGETAPCKAVVGYLGQEGESVPGGAKPDEGTAAPQTETAPAAKPAYERRSGEPVIASPAAKKRGSCSAK